MIKWGVLVVCLAAANQSKVVIDLDRLVQIESGGKVMAFNPRTHARGILQITPILVEEWNNFHPDQKMNLNDLHFEKDSVKVATWYLTVRIPQMLRAFKKPVTRRNVLICWNAGINWVLKEKTKGIPKETKEFLEKYAAKKTA